MDGFVAKKLDDYRTGRISRRRLIQTLTAAASAAAAGSATATTPDPALKIGLVNHVSYTCPDFRRAADWYSNLFNLDQVGASANDVALPFGKKGEHPYGVTADDVPMPYLVIRTPDPNAPVGDTESRRRSRALVNHIAYMIADFDKARVRSELKRMGHANPLADGDHSFHIVDVNGFDVQISGIAMTALSG